MQWSISETVHARAFKPLPLCLVPLKNLLVWISGDSRNERKPLSKQNCVLKKFCGVSQKQCMLELSNLCHCVQYPENWLARDFWSTRNERKPLSKLKHVLRKCSKVSQKQCMLELSNLCHCVQYPWKLTSRDFWSSRNERKPLSKQNCVLKKFCGVSQKQCMLELLNLWHCVQYPENWLVWISGALGMKESHFLS